MIAPTTSTDWDSLDAGKYADETAAVSALMAAQALNREDRAAIRAEAEALVRTARRNNRKQGVVESFLQEFSLSTPEGLALMCLAEALLRTPDEDTRDKLIAEKIGSADWASHAGNSESLFVNASTWGLMLTGHLVEPDADAKRDLPGFLKRLAGRIGEPVIRTAVASAVGIMGEQFVLGRTIERALKRAAKEDTMCSFDMLGEGARTAADAARYEVSYAQAIETVGLSAKGMGPERGHGVSVKLSALCPRYDALHEERVWSELYPRILRLAEIAARHDINFTIDAEEADRLVLSLKLLDRLAHEPSLGGWQGLGLAVQAYQKRGPAVIAALSALAQRSGRRLMVRLVKGAYWDSEIKRGQVNGCPDYPVYTTKAATDLSYLVCARALIEAAPHLYPQFATHNAHTLAAVRRMAKAASAPMEFQRLHGMGEALYNAAEHLYDGVVVRAYAPVGGHEDLLPYLVRRLLENGANTSFVHLLLDEETPPSAVVTDPMEVIEAKGPGPHPSIPTPLNLYGKTRFNSGGIDLSIQHERGALRAAVDMLDTESLFAGPIVSGLLRTETPNHPVIGPSGLLRPIGHVSDANNTDIDTAFSAARAAQLAWDRLGGSKRGAILDSMADTLEANRARLIAILVREAGKTYGDAIAEVREAADFCRYYAHLAVTQFGDPDTLKGPVGETNTLSLAGRGVFVAISPWNFPLAIFTGQIAAALAAGNAVVAKPAEQTPLIACEAVRLFHKAGLPPDVLHVLPGPGETIGAALTQHAGVDGVAFTGGSETAWAINRTLAARRGPIVPFIAETGGLNALFVDTTAQREQVIDDVIVSAFGSAGQRCSSARLLMLPRDTADGILEGLIGAMDTLVIGDPADPATDIGPVIDEAARAALTAHLDRLHREARVLHQLKTPDIGTFFGPVLAEIASLDFLEREVFGPILHVLRYDPRELDTLTAALATKRYGLTLGIHSRIEAFAEEVRAAVPAGNVYINRSMTGAVVGVQPFGGEGLSGTGPKAGGPHALLRYAVERALSVNITAQGGDPALLNL